MKPERFLEILHLCERLKNNTRHADTSTGRRESVAEHSWRLALMAMLLREEFPHVDMGKVIELCLIHDLGEAFTGDKPVFEKTEEDSRKEAEAYRGWIATLPPSLSQRMAALCNEMEARETPEAKLYKALTVWRPSSSTTNPPSAHGFPWSTTCRKPTAGRTAGMTPT